MKSLNRIALETGVIAVVSLAVYAAVSSLRSDPGVSVPLDAPASIESQDANEAAPTVPSDVDSSAVALRAKARVEAEKARIAAEKTATKPVEAAMDRLKKIRACEKVESADCPVGSLAAKQDPGGYQTYLADQSIAELAFLKALAEDDLSQGRNTDVPLENLAGAYIKHPDDGVREQALMLAALLPERDAKSAVEIAVRAIRRTVSGPLTVQALKLMAQTRSSNPELVDQTIRDVLKTGGWDVRDAVAAEILPFITHENRDSFAKILAEAPVRSKLALHLRLGIEEFDRIERL